MVLHGVPLMGMDYPLLIIISVLLVLWKSHNQVRVSTDNMNYLFVPMKEGASEGSGEDRELDMGGVERERNMCVINIDWMARREKLPLCLYI